jgi:hypothetical protein
MAEGLFDFFSRARGQERRAALEGLLTQFIPPELRPQLGLLAEANPVVSMERAGQDAQTVFAPDVALMDRLAAGGRMASNMAGVLAPAAAGRVVGMPAVQAVEEALLGASASPQMAAVRDYLVDDFGGVSVPGFRVFHGSPHDFDKFSMSKIGTGEGAQAYGHGLYFAENEGVARGYRDALTTPVDYRGGGYPSADTNLAAKKVADAMGPNSNPANVIASEANKFRYQAQQILAALDGQPQAVKEANARLAASFENIAAEIEQLNPADFKLNRGSMYEVNINANPEDFLDWDKPLSEQPQVLQRLQGYGGQYRDEVARLRAERDALAAQAPTPSDATDFDAFFADDGWSEGWAKLGELDARIREAEAAAASAEKRGALFSSDLNEDFLTSTFGRNLATASGDSYSLMGAADNIALSQQLREAGIPGIRYLDAGSRGAGDGSRNYVVFDENLIEIVRKYGIAGAATLLGISQADVVQAMQQQQQPQTSGLLGGPQ